MCDETGSMRTASLSSSMDCHASSMSHGETTVGSGLASSRPNCPPPMIYRLCIKHLQPRRDMTANNSFKPRPLRGIVCVPTLRLHAAVATARSGLTQVLGLTGESHESRTKPRLPTL